MVPAEHPRPVQQLRYTQYQNTLVNLLIEQWEGKQLSTHDVVQFILEKLEELNYQQITKEKELHELLTKEYNEIKKSV